MSLPAETSPSFRKSLVVIAGVAFSFLIGGLALLLAIFGLMGKGGAADAFTALPNLVTGITSIAGAAGYWMRKRWAVPVYAVAVVGHFVSHAMLYASHSRSGHVSAGGMLSLWLVPVLALLVFISMRRRLTPTIQIGEKRSV